MSETPPIDGGLDLMDLRQVDLTAEAKGLSRHKWLIHRIRLIFLRPMATTILAEDMNNSRLLIGSYNVK